MQFLHLCLGLVAAAQRVAADPAEFDTEGPVPERGPLIKVTELVRKLPNITDDQFHAYWANAHVHRVLSVKAFTDRIVRYNQVSLLLVPYHVKLTTRPGTYIP